MNIDTIIGIDPGAQGGIAVWQAGAKVKTMRMPRESSELREYMTYLAENFRPVVFLEKLSVRPDDVTVEGGSANLGKLYRIQKMIAQYEDDGRSALLDAPRQYGLTQQHKHLKEMQAVCGLAKAPIFCPIVSDFYSGMVVTVPIFRDMLNPGYTVSDIQNAYRSLYQGPVIRYQEAMDENGFCSANAISGSDAMQISVMGNEERILLISRFDNLGKGASGAAIQCMNIMLGDHPTHGLSI